jgi:hypothetical protein
MAGSHSLLSPSAAHRWSRCHGSVLLARDVPDPSNEAAARGTVMHYMAEQCLRKKFDATCFIGATLESEGFSFRIDEELAIYVQAYVDAILRTTGDRYIEVRLDTSDLLGVPGQGGTADAVVLNFGEKTLEVHDAKFGFGRVMAKGNKQGVLYGGGALQMFDLHCDWQRVKFCIHQPRIDHYDEAVYTLAELRSELSDLRDAAQAIMRITTPEQALAALRPGDAQCQWCPVRGECEARHRYVASMFETLAGDPVKPGLLTDTAVAENVARLDEIEGWCRDMRAEALRRALGGRKLPGFKVVRGKRGARKWRLPKQAEEALSLLLVPEEMYEPAELITPTTAEKKLGPGYSAVRDLVTQSEGGLSIVPLSDTRPPVNVSEVVFEKIEE